MCPSALRSQYGFKYKRQRPMIDVGETRPPQHPVVGIATNITCRYLYK